MVSKIPQLNKLKNDFEKSKELIEKLSQSIITNELFTNKNITDILVKDLMIVPLDVWQCLNNNKIRYKIIKKTEKVIVSITEWLEDDIFYDHLHMDADETISVVVGEITDRKSNITYRNLQSLKFNKGSIHTVEAKKGTIITVVFDF